MTAAFFPSMPKHRQNCFSLFYFKSCLRIRREFKGAVAFQRGFIIHIQSVNHKDVFARPFVWFRWLYVATPQQFTFCLLCYLDRNTRSYCFTIFNIFTAEAEATGWPYRRLAQPRTRRPAGGPWGTGCCPGRGCSAASHCQCQLLVFGTSAIHHHLNLALNAGQYFKAQCCLSFNEVVVNI